MKGKKKVSDIPSSVCTWNFILFYFILLYFHISFHDPICLFSSIFFISLIQSNIQYTRIFYYMIAFWRSFSISDNHVWWCVWWRDRICKCNSNVGFLFPLPPLSSLAKTNKGFVEGDKGRMHMARSQQKTAERLHPHTAIDATPSSPSLWGALKR